jgi:hypothetical protein
MEGTWRSHAPEVEKLPGRETSTFPFSFYLPYKPILLTLLSLCLAGCAYRRPADSYVHETARRPLVCGFRLKKTQNSHFRLS